MHCMISFWEKVVIQVLPLHQVSQKATDVRFDTIGS